VVTNSGERAANLDLCLALTAFSSESWLVGHYCFTSCSIFPLYVEVTITDEELQDLGICPGRGPTPAVTRGLGFSGLIQGPPHLVASYDTHLKGY
jgi:hypothetical protein